MSTAIRKLGEHPCITQSERGEGEGQPNAYVGETKGSCLRNDSMEKMLYYLDGNFLPAIFL